ncbi:uncharacterized protein LOC109836194 [Asparagus officinalis]|uniref:uncharacterized protein LOC109836194 n=1 Tax=Asparagus officinalis TaxID=4686 RepID=UPI00098E107A|nr:uncharacterized protein LOC109836194 [Asparagus officinalis]
MQCPNCRGVEDGDWRFHDVHISFEYAVLQIIRGLNDEVNSGMVIASLWSDTESAGAVSQNASAPVQLPTLEQEESSRTAENRGLQLEPMSPDLPPHEPSEYFTRLLQAPSPIPDLNDIPGPSSTTQNTGTSPAARVRRLPYLRRNMARRFGRGFGSDGLQGAFPLNHQTLDRERVMRFPSNSSSMNTPYGTGAQSTTGVRPAGPGSQLFHRHGERRAYADAMGRQRYQHAFDGQSAASVEVRYNWYLNGRRTRFRRGNGAGRRGPRNQPDQRPSSSNQHDGSPRMRRFF